MEQEVEKLIENNQVAILISPGFGSGWSTWEDKKLAYDKRVVKFVQDHIHDRKFMEAASDSNSEAHKFVKEFLESCGYPNVYLGGNFQQLKIQWLPVGTKYIIREYDGAEYIETIDSINWRIA